MKLALEWFQDNRDKIKNIDYFDFPDYAGLPIHIANKLTSDDVDEIQTYWDLVKSGKFAIHEQVLIIPLTPRHT